MKIKNIIFFVAVFLSILALQNSCVKEDFDNPPSNYDSINAIKSTHSIMQIKSLYDGDSVLITGDKRIEGYVISTDQFGNFYKKIVIQDTSGGIEIELDHSYMFTKYPLGQRLIINLDSLVLVNYRGILELVVDTNSSGTVRLDETNEDKFIVRTYDNQLVEPKVVKITEINDDLLNTLIKIENVQFTNADLNQTWADAISNYSQNHNLMDQDSNILIVRTSGYATFAADTLPSGSGTIVGVLGKYNTDYQLYIRDTSDVEMNNNRF
jgi:uncharacterized protein YdeI (BOF family)